MLKKLFPLALSGMLLFPLGKNINNEKEVAVREVELKEQSEEKKNIFYDFESTLDGNIINTSFNSKIKDVSNIDYVGLNEIDKEILDEVNYSFDIDLENNEIIYTASINSISISTSSSFDFSEGIINGEFDQGNLKLTLKEISNYTSIDQVGLFDFLKRAAENAKRAIEEALRKAEELRQRAIAEAKRIAEEIRRRAEEAARKAREIIEKAVGEAKSFVSDIINVKNILRGDIDSISRDIEGCKSYKDYSKAKSIFERAERVARRAEELEVRVDNKVRSTSIMEALSQINPVRDAVRAIIEYAKKIFNKVKDTFESIKTEYSAFNLYSSVTLVLPEAIKGFVWNLASSIFGGYGGIAKNVSILTNAISNYTKNKETCNEKYYLDQKEANPFREGFINRQSKLIAKVGFGFDFSDKGCGIAATYNLLKYNGKDISLEKLILHFDLMNAYNFAGALGVNPKDISRILSFYGIVTIDRGTNGYKMLDEKFEALDSCIICYMWIERDFIKDYLEKKEEYISQVDFNSTLELVNNVPNYLLNSLFNPTSETQLYELKFKLGNVFFEIPFLTFVNAIVGIEDDKGVKVRSIGAHYAMLYKNGADCIEGYNNSGYPNNKYMSVKEYVESDITEYNICLAGYYVL